MQPDAKSIGNPKSAIKNAEAVALQTVKSNRFELAEPTGLEPATLQRDGLTPSSNKDLIDPIPPTSS
jgi:hypothetical protein